VALVLRLHRARPYARLLGWDVTVDKNNDVQIMECNGGHCEIKSSEAMQGPCFADLGWETWWKD